MVDVGGDGGGGGGRLVWCYSWYSHGVRGWGRGRQSGRPACELGALMDQLIGQSVSGGHVAACAAIKCDYVYNYCQSKLNVMHIWKTT